jgi:hypothetical protein
MSTSDLRKLLNSVGDTVEKEGLERDFCRRRQTRKKALETMSPSEDRRLETTTREKWPANTAFLLRAFSSGFRRTGWWRMQSSETGLQVDNREFFENYRPKQAFARADGD